MPLESVRVENAGAAIRARRQVVQMIEAIVMPLSWHASSLVPFVDGRIHEKQCMRRGFLVQRPALLVFQPSPSVV